MNGRIVVLGVTDPLSPAAAKALESAALLVGARRHLESVLGSGAFRNTALGKGGSVRQLVLGADGVNLEAALNAIQDALDVDAGRVCVLASGDPGFFGIVRSLAERFGPSMLDVHPAPSSVALVFARLGLPWDDAHVVSAHGRSLGEAVAFVASAAVPNVAKVAVLTAPDAPPEALGVALIAAGTEVDRVIVGSRLGGADETIEEFTLEELAAGQFDPISVVVLLRGSGIAPHSTLAWGRPEHAYMHRAGMITKSEVRAVVLARLELPAAGVLWDIGAGSGSVGIEAAGLSAGLHVVAVERESAACEQIRSNAAVVGVSVHVVHGEAPGVLDSLPQPDRIFVGGGGIEVLDAALARLHPDGRLVATYAALDRAVQAYYRLGSMSQVAISHVEPLGDSVRLVAADPVFVCSGQGGGTGSASQPWSGLGPGR